MSRRDNTTLVAKRTDSKPIETDEIRALCESAGLDVVGERTQVRPPDPTHDFGAGAVADLAERAEREDADFVVVDGELDPGRAFNLQDEVGVTVVDRTRLVLDIFAERAETRRARLEVRLAELRYELPHAEAKARRGESSGRRGFKSAGEEPQAAQMRADYRQRIKHVREQLDQLDDVDDDTRSARRESGFDLVALAGYTNAGKSTLLRRLADDHTVEENDARHDDLGETAASRDRLFETLNTTTRSATVGDRDVLVTDTVGFVSDLPHWLVSSFQTTLSAAREADAVLLVVDASDPVSEVLRKVEASLEELDDRDGVLVPVFNKRDVATYLDEKRDAVAELAGDPVVVSATEGDGIGALEKAVVDVLPKRERVSLSVPNSDAGNAFVSWCHDRGTVESIEYGATIDFEFAARPEVATKAEGRADDVEAD